MKVREHNGHLYCWKCNSRLEIDMASATPLIAQLPDAERTKMGRALLSAMSDAECFENPNFGAAVQEQDIDVIKEPWFHIVRESVKEKDAESLSLIAAWFLMHADRKQMLDFVYAMEKGPVEEREPAEVINFPAA